MKRQIDAGWDIGITPEGTITATAPHYADDLTYISVDINYPDGCSESARLRVNTTPPSEGFVPDVTVSENPINPSPPQPRGSSFGSS